MIGQRELKQEEVREERYEVREGWYQPAVEPSGTGCVECLARADGGWISADAPNAGTSAAVIVHPLPIRLSPTATSGVLAMLMDVHQTSGRVVAMPVGFGSPSCRTAARSCSAASLSAPLCRARRSSPTTGAATPALPSAATNTSPSLNGAIRRSPRISANHPSRLRKPENLAERHPSRGQSPAPASPPQRIHLPLQQAVLSVQRLPFPARHRGRRHRTDLRRALLRSLAASYMSGVWVTTG